MSTAERTTNIIYFHDFGCGDKSDKFTTIQHINKECITVDYLWMGVDDVCDLYEDMIQESIRKFDRTILVGHSFGAYFANMFAIKYSLRALLIEPCMRPNVYLVDRMPELARYNFAWETNYSNNIVMIINNDDDRFDVEVDVALLKNAYNGYLSTYRLNGNFYNNKRSDLVNFVLSTLMVI